MAYGQLLSSVIRVCVPCVVFAWLVFSSLRTRFRYNNFKTSLLVISLIIVTVIITIVFLTSGQFLVKYSTFGVILWLVSALVIFRLAIKGSFFEILFVILVILNLYVNIAAISRVILIVLGLSYKNAFAYTLIRTMALVACIPFLWILLEKLYRRVIEFELNFSFWRYLWVLPALLYLIFFTKILPDYWKQPIAAHNIDIVFILLWTVAIYVVFCITLLMLIQNYEGLSAKQNAQLISAQLKAQELQYEKLVENIETTARMRHDWRHHLLSISGFAKDGQLENLKKYLQDLDLDYTGTELAPLCQNHVVDVILQYYAAKAKKDNINLEVTAHLPKTLAIKDTDLCIVFGNLVENALEACVRQHSGEKNITIKAEMNGKHLALLIKNTHQEEIIVQNGVYRSTKHTGVGIGLASVAKVVKNNLGTIKINYDEAYFKVSVLMKVL